jgi:hypothetical protein
MLQKKVSSLCVGGIRRLLSRWKWFRSSNGSYLILGNRYANFFKVNFGCVPGDAACQTAVSIR